MFRGRQKIFFEHVRLSVSLSNVSIRRRSKAVSVRSFVKRVWKRIVSEDIDKLKANDETNVKTVVKFRVNC